MITYDIDYAPESVRDMDAIFDDVLMVSCDPDITHRYLDDLQDKIESMVKHRKTRQRACFAQRCSQRFVF